jgi:hypothetical protein
MNQQCLSKSPYGRVKDDEKLLSAICLRWDALKQPEKVVCATIVLIPLWWLLGWAYVLLILTMGIAVCEFFHSGGLHLKRPSIIATSAVVFGLYRLVSVSSHAEVLTPNLILSQINTWVCCGLLLWYIQSKDVRIRPQVITWACSVAVVEMVVFWLVVHFVLGEPYYNPPLSLFGLLTNKGERYVPGVGNGNYLMPYFPGDRALAGLSRFCFFFPGPESFALAVGFIGLLALDIKNRLWSLLLFLACVFLMLLSGTRSTWIVFPVVVFVRYFFAIGKAWGPSLLCTLIALASFVTLSLPPVTDILFDRYTATLEATGNFRQDSTEVRAKIYTRTLQGIVNEPDRLLFGHGVMGETVLPGYEPAKVGSHSFILGTLLYRSGLVGTGIFITFWASLILWFYNSRVGRPVCCLLVLLYFSLTFLVMELEMSVIPITLVCAVLHVPKMKSLRRVQHA